MEVANVEVDERACGDDSDEEAEAVVAAVRRWQDPWQRPSGDTGADVDDADPSASRRRTYSTTEAHPLHPMRGVPAEALGARLDGPDASLGWMWTMDPLPETPEMAFDPETASRLAAEIADAVLDEEIDAALARAEEALARTGARARASERVRAARFAIPPRISRRPWRGPPRHPPRRRKRRRRRRRRRRTGRPPPGPHRLHLRIRRRPRRPRAAAAERSVSSPATNARRFGSFATRSDIGRGELPRIVPPAPPRISPPRHRARARRTRVPRTRRRSRRGGARASIEGFGSRLVAAVDGTRCARRRGAFADARVESPA